jgi:uncharacterized protein (TIGR03118 family)
MHVRRVVLAAAIASIAFVPALDAAHDNYHVTILVSNEVGDAPVVDMKLVNAWGIAASAMSPWWVADNGSGWSTVYTGAGMKTPTEVMVPGAPTGIVSNSGTQFELAPKQPARFMWASEDGTISAWNPMFDATHAHVVFPIPLVPGSDSIYKGLAIHENTLYATDFGKCKVETLDGTFHEVNTSGGFQDPSIDRRYCPFGIQAIGASIFVSYALKGGMDDVAGISHGFVREFDVDGNLIAEVGSHGLLNSPWGIAMAPPDGFGEFSGCLLVGNFGDGHINAFCRNDQGMWLPRNQLRDDVKPVTIDGLWGIGFGNDHSSGSSKVLYFAAGPDDEMNGHFGKIELIP